LENWDVKKPSSRIREAAAILTVSIIAASVAYAGEFPSPQPPDVFSGDFGITLAVGEADPQSRVSSLGSITGAGFPWDGGFSFPASLPSTPAGAPPAGLPPSVTQPGAGGGGQSAVPVPESEPAVLLGLGLLTLGYAGRKRTV